MGDSYHEYESLILIMWATHSVTHDWYDTRYWYEWLISWVTWYEWLILLIWVTWYEWLMCDSYSWHELPIQLPMIDMMWVTLLSHSYHEYESLILIMWATHSVTHDWCDMRYSYELLIIWVTWHEWLIWVTHTHDMSYSLTYSWLIWYELLIWGGYD